MFIFKLFVFASFISSHVFAQEKKAVAVIQGKTVTGVIRLVQSNTYEPVKVTGTISGLAEGEHGFHIHEKGDLTNGCTSTGSHYNPENKKHGAPHVRDRHVGDLGNIKANKEGIAQIDSVDHTITLHGRNTIIGRAFVVHADPDDFGLGGFNDSLSTGHAGSRLGCGVIGLA